MKYFYLQCLLSAYFFISCSKSGGGGSHSCNLTTGSISAGSNGTVTYSASLQGNGSISQLTYGGATGNVTVNNPSLPYSINVDVNSGTQIGVSATGSTNSGTLTLSYSFVAGGVSQADTTSCGN